MAMSFILGGLSLLWFIQPLGLRRFWANALGWILRSLGLRAEVVQENLKIAFPGDSEAVRAQRARLFIEAYRHIGNLTFEIMMLFGPLGPMKKYALKYGEVRGLEHWRTGRAKGKGIIVLASHVGNWEITSAISGLQGIDIMLVTKHLKPEWLHEAIEKGRTAVGVRATYEPRTFRDVLSHLKKNGTIAVVLDQFSGPPVGVRVPVFGVPVGTHTVVATLAKRTGATVLPTVSYRTPEGKLVVQIEEPVEWTTHENAAYENALNTAKYASILERHIYQHPEQWLWTHRRFKGDLSPLREGEWCEGRARR